MSIKDTGLIGLIIQFIHYTFTREYISTFCEVTELVDGYGFTYPVTVKVTEFKDDGIFIAVCSMFNLHADGKTFDESLHNIKSLIVDDYLALKENYPKDKLSSDAESLLRLYCAVFGFNIVDILTDP